MIQAMNQQVLPPALVPFRGSILALWKYSPGFLYQDEEAYETMMASVLDPDGSVKEIAIASCSGIPDEEWNQAINARPDASPEIIARAKRWLNDHTRSLIGELSPEHIAYTYLTNLWIDHPKGLEVEIVRGRKFPKGDRGIVIAYGEGDYGLWLRIKLHKDGSEIFISKGNVETSPEMAKRFLNEAKEVSYDIQAEAIRHATDFLTPMKRSGAGRYSGGGFVEEHGFTLSSYARSIPDRMKRLIRSKNK